VDLIAVCEQPLSAGELGRLHALLVASLPPPVFPAVDLGILTAGIARRPERPMRWELMVRGEHAGGRLAVSDLGGYPGDLLDVEMARQRGVALIGPEPGEVFAPMPAAWVLGACAEELRVWAGRDHYEDPTSGVLNACRAWRCAEEGVLSSKTGGGEWVRSRSDSPSLIDAALATRKGETGAAMPDSAVSAFVRHALGRVEAAARLAPNS
jgi:hypothetical protein